MWKWRVCSNSLRLRQVMVIEDSHSKDNVGVIFLVRISDRLHAAHTYTNPQTEAFCQMLDIPNFVNPQPCEGMHHDL